MGDNAEVRTITNNQLHRVFLEGVKATTDAAVRYFNDVITTLHPGDDAVPVLLMIRDQFVTAARETQEAIDELR